MGGVLAIVPPFGCGTRIDWLGERRDLLCSAGATSPSGASATSSWAADVVTWHRRHAANTEVRHKQADAKPTGQVAKEAQDGERQEA